MLLLPAGCAARPVNPPITQADPTTGYRFETRQAECQGQGRRSSSSPSRAAARGRRRSRMACSSSCAAPRSSAPNGDESRLLDRVDVITGVSGGSFTALAYGLYGDKLFDDYEQRFLKRDVQGEIIARFFSPANWGDLWSPGWGRSRTGRASCTTRSSSTARPSPISNRGNGPLILASATDISTGARAGVRPGHVRRAVLGPRRRAAVARGRGLVGGAGGAVAGHAQQLRRHLRTYRAPVG